MNIFQEIKRLFDSITEIGGKEPTTIVLNKQAFTDWFYYCEENDLDYTKWMDKQVILDKKQPFRVTVSYHPPINQSE